VRWAGNGKTFRCVLNDADWRRFIELMAPRESHRTGVRSVCATSSGEHSPLNVVCSELCIRDASLFTDVTHGRWLSGLQMTNHTYGLCSERRGVDFAATGHHKMRPCAFVQVLLCARHTVLTFHKKISCPRQQQFFKKLCGVDLVFLLRRDTIDIIAVHVQTNVFID
jgi:hypothetical protein